MKTIALAANGEGYGHASRMVSLVESLGSQYRLVLYAPDSIHDFLKSKLGSRLSQTKINCKRLNLPMYLHSLPGLCFTKQGDRIKYLATLRQNLPVIFSMRRNLAILRKQFVQDGVDVLISDFEPFSTLAARALGLPILQLNHPGVVLRDSSIRLDALLAKLVATLMMGVYTRRQLVSFYDGDIGPLIRDEIKKQQITNTGPIVVFVKKEYRQKVLCELKRNGIHDLLIFPEAAAQHDYAKALAGCRALISSAGHQALSECIYLGKPVFAIPQRGQYEQLLNARKLALSGRGWNGNLRTLQQDLPKFLTAIKNNQWPVKGQRPGLHIKDDDWTDRLLRRIRNFIEFDPAQRIVALDTRLLSNWLDQLACAE